MKAFTKAVKGAKHAVKHKHLANFEGSKVYGADAKYEESASRFIKCVDGIKSVQLRAKLFQQKISSTFNKLIQVVESIEQLGQEINGGIAIKATRLRKMASTLQEGCVVALIDNINNDFIKDLFTQLEAAKKVKDDMNTRLENVADANHYNTKLENLKQQIAANPSKGEKSMEKLTRTEEKRSQSQIDLERGTEELLSHFKNYEEYKISLLQSRTCWLRTTFQAFFETAGKEHEKAFLENGDDDSAIDHSIPLSPDRTTRRKSQTNVISNAKLSVDHWVKHKGAIPRFRGNSSADRSGSISENQQPDSNDEHYESSIANYEIQTKLLKDLSTLLNVYFRHLKSMVESMARLTEDIKALAATDEPEPVEAGSLVFQARSSCDKMELLVLGSMSSASEGKIHEGLEAFIKLPKEIEKRTKAALDVGHYCEKLKSLQVKTDQADRNAKGYGNLMEKVVRNEVKWESSRKELEDQTREVLKQISSFDEMRLRVLQSTINSFSTHQAGWLTQSAAIFGIENGAGEQYQVTEKSLNDQTIEPSVPLPHMKERKSQTDSHLSPTSAFLNSDDEDGENGFDDSDVPTPPPNQLQTENEGFSSGPPRLSQMSSRGSIDLEDVPVVQDEHLKVQNERRRSFGSQGSIQSTEIPQMAPSIHATPMAVQAVQRPQLRPGMVYVRATFEFQGVEEGDLPFGEGDIFQANEQEYNEQDGSGWVGGINLQGKEGIFPANYVERLDHEL